jgi:Carboxypeptidase regulatory-like domain/TonB dependent receptor/TonB-dependent Receptor Plug Domain
MPFGGSKKTVGSFLVLLILTIAMTISAPSEAQVVGGTLSGTVTDTSGAVIPNAQVTIKNIATQVSGAFATDVAGFYAAPNLLPGSYEVTIAAPGFATEVRTGIRLTVGAQQVLNLIMQVGRVTEQVQVAGEAPAVQLATSSISAVVNSTTVRELPLNGRSWTDLATLQPGVDAIRTQHAAGSGTGDRGIDGFGAQVTISGARPQQNNYRLDGISINDYANGAPGSVLGGDLGVDAIQEFSVLTSNYSAEYGKTSGGVVNAITKSGTNQFHGSVYEFLRNSALDARNFFDVGSIPPFKRNQFGAAVGGPIRKDRTFWFGDYEGIRQSKGISVTDTVPSPAARAGNLSTGTVTVDPSVQKYLPLYPLPNGPILPPGDIGIFSFAGQQVVNEKFFTTRVDHKLSQKDNLFGTYMYDDTSFTVPDSFNDLLNGHHTNRQVAVLEEDRIFSPSLVNSARFGYNRTGVADNVGIKALNPLAVDPSLAAAPGRDASALLVSGLSTFSGGRASNPGDYFYWNSFQIDDDAFFTHGAHSLKFGAALERMELNYSSGAAGGEFDFGSLSNFLTNHPDKFSSSFQTSTPRGLRQTIFGLYVQDDWRWRRNLTLNLGLRYEMSTVPTEVQNKLSVLLNLTDPTPHLGNPFFLNPTLRNFEPRVGFAWDPFNNSKTAVRGGVGIFDVLPLPYELYNGSNQATPFALKGSATHLPPGSFFAGAFPLLGVDSLRAFFVEHKPPRNYVMQWNLNLQHQLAPNLTAMIGYVGSRAVHQPFRANTMNIVIPKLTSQGYLWPSPVASGTTINPNFGEIRGIMYDSYSSYHALEVGVEKRMSHGLQFQTSYTWGKSIDTSSSSVVGDTFANAISSLHWFDLRLSRGVSDFNVGRTLVLNGTWQVPEAKALAGHAGWLVNGWELGGIYTASDGVPFTATFGTNGDPLGLNGSDTWDFPNRLVGPGCQSLINPGNPNNYIKTQCFAVPTASSLAFYSANCDPAFGTFPQCFNLRGNAGRNILTGPGTSNLDFSVIKNNYLKRISESFNVQFRAEFFNILNRANFSVPVTPDNTDIFDSTGTATGVAGLLTSTSTTAREIQFALKLIW